MGNVTNIFFNRNNIEIEDHNIKWALNGFKYNENRGFS